MEIRVYAQILDGNLGDGWKDNYEAATALAEFSKDIWNKELSAKYPDADITFEIDVQRNTCGSSRSVVIDCSEAIDLSDDITDESSIWDVFCSSDIAKDLYSED